MKKVLLEYKQLLHLNRYDNIAIDASLLFDINIMTKKDFYLYLNNKFLSKNIVLNDFVNKRINLEKKFKNIDCIYNKITNDINLQKQLKDTEIETLIELSCINQVLYKFLDSFKGNVNVINNTEYDEKVVSKILETIGYKQKLNFIRNLNCFSSNTIVLLSKKRKIECVSYIVLKKKEFISKTKYKKIIKYEKPEMLSRINFSIICAFINNNIDYSADYFYQNGFSCYGIFLFGFCNFLIDNIDTSQKIYFLSRDTYIIKKAFNIINSDKEYETHYMYVSRNSLKKANYYKFQSPLEICNYCNYFDFNSYEEILLKLGLEDKIVKEILFKYGNKNVKANKEEFLKIIESYKNKIKVNSFNTSQALKKYLYNIGFSDNSVIVDIGWHGTIQNELINNTDKKIVGYYAWNVKNKYTNEMYSFIDKMDVLPDFAGPVELFFSSFEGTVIDYKNGFPILDNYEYSSKQRELINNMHNGALDFIKKFKLFIGNNNIKIDVYASYMLLKNFCENPSKMDLRNYNNFQFSGTDRLELMLIPYEDFKKFIFKPSKLFALYKQSSWKLGIYKQLGFLGKLFAILYRLLKQIKNFMEKVK